VAWGASVACIVAILILASPWLLVVPFFYDHQPMSSGGSSTFIMVGSTPSAINVPNCAVVSVSWTDLAGRAVGFGSYQGGPDHLASSCSDAGIPLAPESPPNHCPPWFCNYTGAVLESALGTYQVGSSGTFEFVDTQGAFGFWANVDGNNSTSQDPISIHYIYSIPIFSAGETPPGSPPPSITPFEWIFFIPVVIAGWLVSIRLLRGGRGKIPS
jgi:hypothetical protein